MVAEVAEVEAEADLRTLNLLWKANRLCHLTDTPSIIGAHQNSQAR